MLNVTPSWEVGRGFSQLTSVPSTPPLLHRPYFPRSAGPQTLQSPHLLKLLSLIDPRCFAFHVCTGEEKGAETEKGEMGMYVGQHSENPSENGREREHGH